MSFDGAKVRRFFGIRKRLRQIVRVNSPFVDEGQRISRNTIFLDFLSNMALFRIYFRTFAPQKNHYI